MSGDFDDTTDVPAARPTIGGGLRAAREQARKVLYKDLRVPRYNDPDVMPNPIDLWVRFKPVSSARIEQVGKAAEKSKDRDRSVNGNATVLADACVGIYQVVDGEKVSPDETDRGGDWPRFDRQLGEMLDPDSPPIKASDVVRALYLTDGDITAVAGELAEWSGFANQDLDEAFSGN